MASDYAKRCIWAHGNPENITPYQHVGQNLAYSRGGAPSSPLYLISHWYNEKKNYDVYTDTCLPDTVCGHYTQVSAPQLLFLSVTGSLTLRPLQYFDQNPDVGLPSFFVVQ